jgi:hypothetical protein
MKMKKLSAIISFFAVGLAFAITTPMHAESAPTPTPTVQVSPSEQQAPAKASNTRLYIAEIVDAAEVTNPSNVDNANSQLATLQFTDKSAGTFRIDTTFTFPNNQFKRPLKIGDKLLVEAAGDLSTSPALSIVSLYRQNNLLIWVFILGGLFILVAGFRTNLKYFQIFIITIISGLLVLAFYHRNTFITFGALFMWQLIASVWFSFRVFRKKTPTLVLSLSIFANQILAMGLVFVMYNIDIFDTGFFEIFFPSRNDAREVMLYILSVLVLYPVAIVFSEQIISESIKKKREENDIVRANLIRYVSRSALRSLNHLFLTFFGLFFSIGIGVVAIASREDTVTLAINSSVFAQIISVGTLILFDLLIFIPIVSFVSGMWLGKLESHQLVTDKNLRQLEL